MLRSNPIAIIKDQFRPFFSGRGRAFSLAYFIEFCVVPLAVAILTVGLIGRVAQNAAPLFLAGLSVFGAVMVGLLPVVHSLTRESSSLGEQISEKHRSLIESERDTLDVLREIYNTISYSVIVIVLGVLFCIPLVVCLPKWLGNTCSAVAIFAAATTLICLLSIMTGMYAILERQSESRRQRISQVLRDLDRGSIEAQNATTADSSSGDREA